MTHLYPWQEETWQQVWSHRERLPHALILAGKAGLGQLTFARHLAKSLLCRVPAATGACGACPGCKWFDQEAHPDFREVRPEGVDSAPAAEGAPRGGGRMIKVDQIRDLADFIHLSSHQSGYRIVLLAPADAMNANAANSLLKMLEEPPAQALILLVSDAPSRLLPTIRSRCQQVSLVAPPQDVAEAWLTAEGVPDPRAWLAFSGNAPLHARDLAHGEHALWQAFVSALAGPGELEVATLARSMEKAERVDVAQWLLKWVYDLVAMKLTGALRFYPGQADALARISLACPLEPLMAGQRDLEALIRDAAHPSLNNQLFLEQLLIRYKAMLGPR